MANPQSKPQPKQEYFSYPQTPRQYVDDCIVGLRMCLEEVPIDSISYIIIRRVITDIEHTSKKIC